MQQTKEANTPGIRDDETENEGKINLTEQKKMRRIISLLNYVSQGRADLSLAVKEVARQMAEPLEGTTKAVHRNAEYLHGHRRCLNWFLWQRSPGSLVVKTDSDWAGCRKARRSASGGAIVLAGHLITHWSRTQASVPLSSVEAELVFMVKGCCEVIGAGHGQ